MEGSWNQNTTGTDPANCGTCGIVVTTCTVTGEADHKARKAVRHALGLPQEPVVVVSGCLASLDPEGLRAIGDRVVVEQDRNLVAQRVADLRSNTSARTPRRARRRKR